MATPENYAVELKVPAGPVTVDGTRRNARMVVEYLEGWLNGRGAKGIDSLAGKPGIHPALMEDLATGRMSVAQIAQRIRHRARDTHDAGRVHDFAMVKRLLQEETTDILARLEATALTPQTRRAYTAAEKRYRQAYKIALQWIKNYTELNFRSLGSYPRSELESIGTSVDAF
jgi:malate synthase